MRIAQLLILLLPLMVRGQWQSTHGPRGALDVRGLLVTDSVVLAGTLCGTFSSTDRGATWVPVLAGSFHRAVRFQGSIYTDINGFSRLVPLDGEWSVQPLTGVGDLLDLHAGQELLAGVNYSGFRYSTNGTDWSGNNIGLPRDSLFTPNGVWVHFHHVYAVSSDGSARYAGTAHGVYRTTAPDQPWQSASNGLPDARVDLVEQADGVLLAAVGNTTYRSVDQATTWQAVLTLAAGSTFRALVAEGGTWKACTDGQGLWSSTDGGLTWTTDGVGLAEVDVRAAAWVDGTWLVGTDRALYAGTGTYTPSQQGLVCSVVQDLASVGGTVVATQLDAAHVLPQPGGIWQRTTDALPVGAMWDVEVLEDDYLIAAIPPGLGPPASINYRASASGQGWQAVSELVNYGDPYVLRSNGTLVVAFTDDLLFLSQNGAVNWTEIGPASGGGVCNAINDAAWYGDTLFTVKCSAGDVLRSTDLGGTWNFANNGLPNAEPYTIRALPTGLFIATYEGLYRSVNGGASWSFAGGGLPDHWSFEPSGYVQDIVSWPPFTFLCTNDAVYAADAEHSMWTNISVGLPALSQLFHGALLVKDDTLYFGTNGHGVYKRGLQELALAMPEVVVEGDLEVYPNPAEDVLGVGGDLLRAVELVDALGRAVVLPVLGAGRYDVSGAMPGVYVLRGRSRSGVMRTARVVVR
jgi:hypothetical protein